MRRCASTKAWTPDAHAATEVITGPRIPFWMLIWHAAIDGDIIGTMNGLTRSGPFAVQRHLADRRPPGVRRRRC